MGAIGLLETKGLVGLLSALDQMLKSANISILEKNVVGGGLVTGIITGDVADVTVAVDIGRKICEDYGCLVSAHVIARCSEGVSDMLISSKRKTPMVEKSAKEVVVVEESVKQVDVQLKPALSLEERLSLHSVKQLRKMLNDRAKEGHNPSLSKMSKNALISLMLEHEGKEKSSQNPD